MIQNPNEVTATITGSLYVSQGDGVYNYHNDRVSCLVENGDAYIAFLSAELGEVSGISFVEFPVVDCPEVTQ